MLSNLQFERSAQQYRVLDPQTGEAEYFPKGYSGRQEAMRRAVYYQNERLHRIVVELVRRHNRMESRAWRAAELMLNGGVKQADGEVIARITSSSADGDYMITTNSGLLVCDCIDYIDGNAPYVGKSGQRLCKHILALQFSRRLQYRFCGSCGRKVDAELMICIFCDGPVHPY